MSVSQLVRLNHGLSLSLSISSGFSSGSLTALAFQPQILTIFKKFPSLPPSLPNGKVFSAFMQSLVFVVSP